MSGSRPSPDPIYTLRGSGAPVTCLKFRTCDQLFSGNGDGAVHVWCMSTRRLVNQLDAHTGYSVLWIDFIDDGCMLTQGRDSVVRVWTHVDDKWKQTGEMKAASMGFCKACLVGRNMVCVPSDLQSEVDLYDLDTRKVTTSLKPNDGDKKYGMVMAIRSAHPDVTKLLIGYEDGSVACWDTGQNKMVDCVKLHEDSIMCLGYSPVLTKCFSGSVNEKLCSWKLSEDRDRFDDKKEITVKGSGFNDILVREDGKIVVFAGWDAKVRVFGAKHLKPLAVLDYHKESVHCVDFSADNILACGSKDQHISLWDIYR